MKRIVIFDGVMKYENPLIVILPDKATADLTKLERCAATDFLASAVGMRFAYLCIE